MSSAEPDALFCLADEENQRLPNSPHFYWGGALTPPLTVPLLRLQLAGRRRHFPGRIPSAPDNSLGRQSQATNDAEVDRIISVNADKIGLRRHRRHCRDVTSIQ